MPKRLQARPALDAREAHQVRKLATSTHAPADWIFHAKMIVRSWDGARTSTIAAELGCNCQSVRERFHAFSERGLDGLGMRPGGGRKARLSEVERSTILALVKTAPPGKPGYERTGEFAAEEERPDAAAEWTLDTLTAAARVRGIQVARSQVRRIFVQEGVRWRRTHPWATSTDPDFVPKGRGSSRSPPTHRLARRSSASTNWVR
ncbi:MAG TPA: helix-turn-helix domain-containing protein [Ktedonobacterales bacterium]